MSYPADHPEATTPFCRWPAERLFSILGTWVLPFAVLAVFLVSLAPVVQDAYAFKPIAEAGGKVEVTYRPWLSRLGVTVKFPPLTRVSGVVLQDCAVDDKTWQAVLHFADRGLRDARLNGTGLTDRQLAELTERSPDLEQLEIHDSRLTNQGLASLASCPKLTNLAVSSTQLKTGWVSKLPALTSLEQLELSGIEWNQETTAVFSTWTRLNTLTLTEVTFPGQLADGNQPASGPPIGCLRIRDSTLTEAGLQLISCREVRSLVFLDVTFPATGCRHLSRLKHLEGISLHRCRISDECAAHLAACHGLTDITFLDCPVNGSCLQALSTLPEVDELGLKGTNVEDSQLRYLADFPKLEGLDLQETIISDAAIPHLEQCRRLRYILLSGSRITASDLARLEASLPDCQIHHDIETDTPAHATAD